MDINQGLFFEAFYSYRYFKLNDTLGILNIMPGPAYAAALPRSFDPGRLACFFTADYPSEARENPERPPLHVLPEAVAA